jgi:hypothetical protein
VDCDRAGGRLVTALGLECARGNIETRVECVLGARHEHGILSSERIVFVGEASDVGSKRVGCELGVNLLTRGLTVTVVRVAHWMNVT